MLNLGYCTSIRQCMLLVHVSYVKYKEFVLHHTVSLGNMEGDFHFFLNPCC
jgi:hypothetical protein